MNPRILALTLTAVFLLSSLQAQDASPAPINPALLYWQAAAQLPKLSDQQAKEVKEMARGIRPVDRARLEDLGLRAAEDLLRRAAISPAPCDWGLAREVGPEMPLPHLPKIVELGYIAMARAEALFAQGKTKEGIEGLLIAHRIARHAGAGQTLVSYLVQASLETTALQADARHCLGWDAPLRQSYAQSLKALPPLHTLQEGYQGEAHIVDWFEQLGQLGESERIGKLEEMFAMLSGEPAPTGVRSVPGPKDPKETEQIQHLAGAENLREELAALRDVNRRAEAAFGKPWKEAEAELAAIQEDVLKQGFYLARLTFPPCRGVHDVVAKLATLRTMLDLGLQHGGQLTESLVGTARDAFEGEPLQLKKEDDGTLSLIAARQHPKGKDIELKLGK